MSEKPLLLSSTKSTGALAAPASSKWGRYVRIASLIVGLIAIAAGVADVSARIAKASFGSDAAFVAFAPAIALQSAQTQTGQSTVATTSSIVPARLIIPSIGVNAPVEQVGKKDDGSVGTPHVFGDVGWYMLGPKPGQSGNAIIDGHVNNALTKAGVFEHLSQLRAGDIIIVSDSQRNALTYVVTAVSTYSVNNAPVDNIFSTTGPSQLVLITCDGDWVQSAHSFDKRLVVYASLKQ